MEGRQPVEGKLKHKCKVGAHMYCSHIRPDKHVREDQKSLICHFMPLNRLAQASQDWVCARYRHFCGTLVSPYHRPTPRPLCRLPGPISVGSLRVCHEMPSTNKRQPLGQVFCWSQFLVLGRTQAVLPLDSPLFEISAGG